MCNKGIVKRLLPFSAAFVIGIFVASFFVNIGGPRFDRGSRGQRFHRMQQLKMENEELRNEVLRLSNELDSRNIESGKFSTLEHEPEFEGRGPEYPVVPPPPPRVSHSHR